MIIIINIAIDKFTVTVLKSVIYEIRPQAVITSQAKAVEII